MFITLKGLNLTKFKSVSLIKNKIKIESFFFISSGFINIMSEHRFETENGCETENQQIVLRAQQ